MAHHPKAIAAFNLCFHKALAFSSLARRFGGDFISREILQEP